MNYPQTKVARATIEFRRPTLIQFRLLISFVTAWWRRILARRKLHMMLPRPGGCFILAAGRSMTFGTWPTISRVIPKFASQARQSRIDHHGP
jgi:hypothetical protein